MANDFFAYLSKMRYINRWALMRNSMNENLSEHSLETAYISHALAIISNKRLGNNVDISRVVLRAIYHDCSEILTGDLPTPVKYNNPEIKKAYKDLEKLANRKLLKLLPDDMREEYEEYFEESTDEKEEELVWAADKLSAVIKCLQEENAGNREFVKAKQAIMDQIHKKGVKEAEIFIEEFLPAYELTLDEMD